jgi:hypothetical protein
MIIWLLVSGLGCILAAYPDVGTAQEEAAGWLPPRVKTATLLQQFQNKLLLLVSLGESGNTGLLQN